GRPAGPLNAKTWSVPGRSSRPSATDGVGKWFADAPNGITATCLPLAGLRPCTALSAPIVQTSPPAMIGAPAAPSLSVHSCLRCGAVFDTLIAVTPFGHGR